MLPTKLPVIVFLPQLATTNAIEISESKIPEQFFPTFDFNSQRKKKNLSRILPTKHTKHSGKSYPEKNLNLCLNFLQL